MLRARDARRARRRRRRRQLREASAPLARSRARPTPRRVRERRPSVTPNRHRRSTQLSRRDARHGDDVDGPRGTGADAETLALDARSSEVEIGRPLRQAARAFGRDAATRRHTHERQMRRERGLRRHRPVPRPRRRDARFVVGVGGDETARARESLTRVPSVFAARPVSGARLRANATRRPFARLLIVRCLLDSTLPAGRRQRCPAGRRSISRRFLNASSARRRRWPFREPFAEGRRRRRHDESRAPPRARRRRRVSARRRVAAASRARRRRRAPRRRRLPRRRERASAVCAEALLSLLSFLSASASPARAPSTRTVFRTPRAVTRSPEEEDRAARPRRAVSTSRRVSSRAAAASRAASSSAAFRAAARSASPGAQRNGSSSRRVVFSIRVARVDARRCRNSRQPPGTSPEERRRGVDGGARAGDGRDAGRDDFAAVQTLSRDGEPLFFDSGRPPRTRPSHRRERCVASFRATMRSGWPASSRATRCLPWSAQARRQPRAVVLQELVLGVRRAFRLRLHIQRDDERTRDQLRVRGVHGRVRPSFDAFDDVRAFHPTIFRPRENRHRLRLRTSGHLSGCLSGRCTSDGVQIGGSVAVRRVRPDTRARSPKVASRVLPPCRRTAAPTPSRRTGSSTRSRPRRRRASRLRANAVERFLRLVDFLGRECLLRVLPDRPVRDVVHDRSEREVDVRVVEPSGVRGVRGENRRHDDTARSVGLNRSSAAETDGRLFWFWSDADSSRERPTNRTTRRSSREAREARRTVSRIHFGSGPDIPDIPDIPRKRARGCRAPPSAANNPNDVERPVSSAAHGYFPRRRVVGHHARLARGALRAYSCGAHRRGGLAREHAPGGRDRGTRGSRSFWSRFWSRAPYRAAASPARCAR